MDIFRDNNKKWKELIPTGEYAGRTLEQYETSGMHIAK